MPQSVFDYKTPSQVQGAAWTQELAIAPPGSLAAPLFALYPSLGDTTIATATNLTTIQDGPSKVWRFGALTVNALLSFTKRARPQFILCDSLVMGAGGGMSMTARGAAGAANWPIVDLTIPQSVRLSANKIAQRDVLSYITQNGIWIGDPVFWAFPDASVADCRAVVTPGSVALLSAAGCGTIGLSMSGGLAGSSGGTGSGGAGAGYYMGPGWAGNGNPWGGGSGGGGACASGSSPVGGPQADQYGGPGGKGYTYNSGCWASGGTGNPGGAAGTLGGAVGNDGTGGVLVIICRGNITRNASDSITANGVAGAACSGGAYNAASGGSGGGHVSIIYGGTLTGTGNTTASGGASGGGSASAGGAGSVVTKTFAQMGWT